MIIKEKKMRGMKGLEEKQEDPISTDIAIYVRIVIPMKLLFFIINLGVIVTVEIMYALLAEDFSE